MTLKVKCPECESQDVQRKTLVREIQTIIREAGRVITDTTDQVELWGLHLQSLWGAVGPVAADQGKGDSYHMIDFMSFQRPDGDAPWSVSPVQMNVRLRRIEKVCRIPPGHQERTQGNRLPRSDRRDGVLFGGDWLPLVGVSVATAKALLRDAWGIPYFADTIVNGRPALVSQVVLRSGDRLVFSQRFGFKAGEQQSVEQAQAESLVIAYPELMDIAARVKRVQFAHRPQP